MTTPSKRLPAFDMSRLLVPVISGALGVGGAVATISVLQDDTREIRAELRDHTKSDGHAELARRVSLLEQRDNDIAELKRDVREMRRDLAALCAASPNCRGNR